MTVIRRSSYERLSELSHHKCAVESVRRERRVGLDRPNEVWRRAREHRHQRVERVLMNKRNLDNEGNLGNEGGARKHRHQRVERVLMNKRNLDNM